MSLGKVAIREYLVANGYSEEELNGKKVEELREIMDTFEKEKLATEAALDSIEEEEETNLETIAVVVSEDEPEEEKEDPKPSDPDWTQFVLGHFQDDEQDEGNPRVEGLRRVAEALIGPIVHEDCELIQAPSHENGMTACAKASITFFDVSLNREVTYSALADANDGNIFAKGETDFTVYLTAMADTRAKGRAFRAALKLRRVVAAEEVGRGINLIAQDTSSISSGAQIAFATMLSGRMGVNLTEIVDTLEFKHEKKNGVVQLATLSHDDMLALLKKLNELNAEGLKEDGK